MGFNTLIANLLSGVADPLLDSLQDTVDHYLFSERSVDDYNKPTWGDATSRKAVVEPTTTMVRRPSGDGTGILVQARYKVTFPRPVDVDVRDKIVLSNGVTGPILEVKGVTNPDTNAVYATEVLLG